MGDQVPAAQATHRDAEGPDHVPALHDWQVEELIACDVADQVPATHPVQVPAFAPDQVPATQGVQDAALAAEKVPAPQLWQADDP